VSLLIFLLFQIELAGFPFICGDWRCQRFLKATKQEHTGISGWNLQVVFHCSQFQRQAPPDRRIKELLGTVQRKAWVPVSLLTFPGKIYALHLA